MTSVDELPDAVPLCETWRGQNPEPVRTGGVPPMAEFTVVTLLPAPYCCSAYCARCAELRRRDGVPPLEPNEWMSR